MPQRSEEGGDPPFASAQPPLPPQRGSTPQRPVFHNHLGRRIPTQEILTGRSKLALFFPGLNYSLDSPMFHYLAQSFPEWRFDVLGIELGYGRDSDYLALTTQERVAYQGRDSEALAPQLANFLEQFEDVVVVSKSLGARLVNHLLSEGALKKVSHFVWLTPAVAPRFMTELGDSALRSLIVLGGSDTTYAPSEEDQKLAPGARFLTIAGAGHSLDVANDLTASLTGLQVVVKAVGEFVGGVELPAIPATTPQVTGLDHVQVAIPVGSEPEARAFYCNQLGFPEVEKPSNLKKKGGLWVQCGAHQLHLGVQDPYTPATKAHPAFSVQGLSDLRARWETLGVAPRDEDELPGADRFYVSDPFGNRLEFLEWRILVQKTSVDATTSSPPQVTQG